MSDSPKVLLFDVETTPLTSYTWGTYQQNVIEVVQEWRMLSFAWKWHGERGGVRVEDAEGVGDDYQLACDLRELFDEAHVVVAHNAARFDVPKANARMAWWGLEPPSPYKIVDTLQIARKQFKFTSNRLDDLCAYLGLGHKLRHQGFGLWKGCMADDPKAWAVMRRYNKHDVVLLERLYESLRPWAPNLPNLALIADRPAACPKCGVAGKMSIRGYRYYQVTKRVAYQCGACHGYSYGRKLEKSGTEYVA